MMEKLTIDLKTLCEYDKAYRLYGRTVTAYCPLSLFIYEKERGLEIYRDGEAFIVKRPDGWFLPVADPSYIKDFIASHKGERLVCLTENQLLLHPLDFEHTPDEDEYVYDRAEQNTLFGPKFSKVRAKLKRFEREHEVVSHPVTRENIGVLYGILDKWEPASGEGDKEGARRALDNFFALGLTGCITYLDGEAVSYCCGADISKDTYMLCSAKQISSVQGLNIKNKYDLYLNLPDQITLINTESDHGQAGVRMHKSDLRPIYLIKTYSAVM